MIIASNLPGLLSDSKTAKLVHLVDGTDSANAIVLILRKDWGSGNIRGIREIAELIATYPREVPCYLIGCETKIPNLDIHNIHKYRHSERDAAILALCKEVLGRSNSIGVRGSISYRYITQILGLTVDQVQLIYEDGAPDNDEKLRKFLDSINFPFPHLEKDLARFQRNPAMPSTEKRRNFSKMIEIGAPYVSYPNPGAARLNADLLINGEVKTLWCEVDKKYENALVTERSDAFVSALLPYAMRNGHDLKFQTGITAGLLNNLREILIPLLGSYDPLLHQPRIRAAPESSELAPKTGVATAMSGGVDSFYSVSRYSSPPSTSMKLTHLYVGNYQYGNSGPIYDRARKVAAELDIHFVRSGTNLSTVLELPHLQTHFFKTMFGVLSISKLFNTYIYSSGNDLGVFNLASNRTKGTGQFELLLLLTFNFPGFYLVSGGGAISRTEKIEAISELNVVQNNLNVCLYPQREINCGQCAKCLRTLLVLDMLGKLDQFRNVFPIDAYLENRLEALNFLAAHKNSRELADVYRFFLQEQPAAFSKVEDQFHPKHS